MKLSSITYTTFHSKKNNLLAAKWKAFELLKANFFQQLAPVHHQIGKNLKV